MTDDPIIDRSPAQVANWISELRIAIIPYGFSIVRTEWLHQVFEKQDKAHSHEHQNPHPTPQEGAADVFSQAAR